MAYQFQMGVIDLTNSPGTDNEGSLTALEVTRDMNERSNYAPKLVEISIPMMPGQRTWEIPSIMRQQVHFSLQAY